MKHLFLNFTPFRARTDQAGQSERRHGTSPNDGRSGALQGRLRTGDDHLGGLRSPNRSTQLLATNWLPSKQKIVQEFVKAREMKAESRESRRKLGGAGDGQLAKMCMHFAHYSFLFRFSKLFVFLSEFLIFKGESVQFSVEIC